MNIALINDLNAVEVCEYYLNRHGADSNILVGIEAYKDYGQAGTWLDLDIFVYGAGGDVKYAFGWNSNNSGWESAEKLDLLLAMEYSRRTGTHERDMFMHPCSQYRRHFNRDRIQLKMPLKEAGELLNRTFEQAFKNDQLP